jgi:AAA15 family ATPase/GTPase
MVAEIELANDQALVLIEEIENGLHPVATVRMVEYLIDVAERKKLQAIFTTHSNDALKPLPSRAIWVATQDRIFQGKLDIQSLNP